MAESVQNLRRRAGRTGCAVEATMSVVGGVWKPVLVFHLLPGRLRFNALCRLTPNATARMVTLQLRELEADGIIRRIVYPEVPPKVEYELTDFGRTLEPVLLSLRDWGEAFRSREEPSTPTGTRVGSHAERPDPASPALRPATRHAAAARSTRSRATVPVDAS